jgi:tryptophan-rich sensory protein
MKPGFQALLLAGLLILTLVPSSILAHFYPPSKSKGYALVKPAFTPPNAVFGVVWPCLYILQALSLFLVLRRAETMKSGSEEEQAILIGLPILFGLSLALNYAWVVVFYQASPKAYKDSLWILLGLGVMIAWIWVLLLKTSALAAFLWTPYLVWVAFATLMASRIVTRSH